MSYMSSPPPPPPPTHRPGRSGLKIIAVILSLFLLLSIVANLVMFLMVIVFAAATGASNSEGPSSRVEAETLHAGRSEKIAVVPVSGTVDETMTEQMLAYCEYIKKDAQIRGVVLEIDSPGGGITASDEIHHLFTDLKASGRRVVVSMRSLAASGGYYISMPADKIYAQPTTLTGSIGVIWPAFEVSKLLDKTGVTPEIIKSDSAKEFKDAGSPFKAFTDKDREYIRGLVNNAQLKFSAVVDAGRAGKLKDSIKNLAIGKIWSADEALKLGLIDEIAYLDEVCEKTSTDLGLRDPTILRLRRKTGLLEALTASTPLGSPKVEIKLDAKSLESLIPKMEYRAPALQ